MKTQLRLQSIGAALVVLLLVAMFFVQLPQGLAYPGLEILRGDLTLPSPQQAAYLHAMQIIFALDGIFLAAQLLAWTGIAQVLRTRAVLPAILALILGLIGVLMDLT